MCPMRWALASLALAALAHVACASGASGSPDGGQGGSDGGGVADARPMGPDGDVPKEVCDGTDNDGDQFVDEGDPVDLCPPVENGTPRCNGLGGCSIESCGQGYVDVDNLYSNGCECGQEASENGAQACDAAIDLGAIPDSDNVLEVSGNLVPLGDVDFFRFVAIDNADSSCDTFHVRVQFLENPEDEFRFEVLRGGCAGAPVCSSATDMRWYTNFNTPGPPPLGQCPCSAAGSPGVNICSDDSAEFIVRVFRAPGRGLSCNSYKLEISNGKYAP